MDRDNRPKASVIAFAGPRKRRAAARPPFDPGDCVQVDRQFIREFVDTDEQRAWRARHTVQRVHFDDFDGMWEVSIANPLHDTVSVTPDLLTPCKRG